MSKMETHNVTKRDIVNGDTAEKMRYLSGMKERLANFEAKDRSDKVKYPADFIYWMAMNCKLPAKLGFE
jgi:hypothetical protein